MKLEDIENKITHRYIPDEYFLPNLTSRVDSGNVPDMICIEKREEANEQPPHKIDPRKYFKHFRTMGNTDTHYDVINIFVFNQ